MVEVVKKKLRLSSHEIGPDSKCQCHLCFEDIPQQDIEHIAKEFNALTSVDEQNAYLCVLLTVYHLQQHKPRNPEENASFHDNVYFYQVRIQDEGGNKDIVVWYKALISNTKDVTDGVVNHISSSEGWQSHYSRKESERVYLPDTLNINKIDTCIAFDKYQVDVTALQQTFSDTLLPSDEKNTIEKHMETAQVANKIRKRNTQVFYEREQSARKESMKSEKHKAIASDFQKNLPMPILTTNDLHYQLQLLLYSINIHTLATGNSLFYRCQQMEGRKCSDEVTSFLHHFIFNFLVPRVKDLECFCDEYAGQNKKLDSINLTFPVFSHTYLERDRNMALINQKYPAELPEYWVVVFESAHMKPLLYYIVNVDTTVYKKLPDCDKTSYQKFFFSGASSSSVRVQNHMWGNCSHGY
ncbi:hypothetical protein PR048_012633 [Dryococelus australis]|uniref:Uncharacterized protein n=1 Tax=Dryococelus australis TaxID=614101 RepID=A0ABQ9HQ04_9NEOP|nr:hypothetical protein PR048_012633 [Dryococelus australis]